MKLEGNKNLAATQITDKIRVSTAIMVYSPEISIYPYTQYETFIFSDNPQDKLYMEHQVIVNLMKDLLVNLLKYIII